MAAVYHLRSITGVSVTDGVRKRAFDDWKVEKMSYIPDNYDRWEAHDREKERKLMRRPRCRDSREPIQTDYCYGENGRYICEHCLNEYYRVPVEDLM